MVYSHRHQGVIESLNFPNNYPANGLCSWTIQASTGNTINYTFNAFQLEATSSCSFDYIKVNTFTLPHSSLPAEGRRGDFMEGGDRGQPVGFITPWAMFPLSSSACRKIYAAHESIRISRVHASFLHGPTHHRISLHNMEKHKALAIAIKYIDIFHLQRPTYGMEICLRLQNIKLSGFCCPTL